MDSSAEIVIPSKELVFFDGYCNLCNGAIDFIIQRDPSFKFVFESLQSDASKKILPEQFTKSLEYIVVRKSNGELLTKSKAVFFIAAKLSGVARVLSYFRFLPTFVTDFFYTLIAKNRYKLFGKREVCRMPTEDDKLRFLEGYQNS